MATEAEILNKLNDLLDGISSVLDGAGASKLVTLDRTTGADAALVYLRENGDEKFRWGMPGGEDDFVIQRSPDGSPLSYADVFRIDAATGAITITGLALDGGSFADPSFTGQSLFAAGSAGAPSIATTGDTNTGLFFPGADQVALATGGQIRLAVDDTGRVSIGISSPATGARLHVSAGDANGIVQITGGTKGVRIGTDANQGIIEGVDSTGVTSFQPLFINGSRIALGADGSEIARLTSAGFAVGSTGADYGIPWRGVFRHDQNASTELGLINAAVGSDAAMKMRFIGGTGNSFMVAALFDNDGAPNFEYLYGSAVSYVRWVSGGTEFMRYVRSNGNFGIGTQNPSEKLDVNSDAIRVRSARTPASASAPGETGTVCWDAAFVYVCTATDTWVRAGLSSW